MIVTSSPSVLTIGTPELFGCKCPLTSYIVTCVFALIDNARNITKDVVSALVFIIVLVKIIAANIIERKIKLHKKSCAKIMHSQN